MSSLDDKSTFDKIGDGCGKGESVSTSNKKECTSCEQKVDNCKDGASNSSICSSDIDAVAEGISRVGISNGDNTGGSSNADINNIVKDFDSKAISDEKLFADSPPKEDCPICMLPMPHASGICGVGKTYMPCCGKMLCEGCVMESMIEKRCCCI